MRILLAIGILFYLAGCAQPVPPGPQSLDVELLDVERMRISEVGTREIMIRARFWNTTTEGMWLLPSDRWYRPQGDAPITSAVGPKISGNYSECTPGPVPPGIAQGCTLFFDFGGYYPNEEIIPGFLAYSEDVYSLLKGFVLVDAYTE